jgi:hypothetical protein
MDVGTIEVVQLDSLIEDLAKCESTLPCDHLAAWRGTMTCPCNLSYLMCDECRSHVNAFCSDEQAFCIHCEKRPVFVTWLPV